MTKIAFFDIDGTLIHVPSGMMEPSAYLKQAIQEFRNRGNLVVIASARNRMPEVIEALNPDGFIGCDGHFIELCGDVLLHDVFSEDEVNSVESVVLRHCGGASFSGREGCWYSNVESNALRNHVALYQGSFKLPDGYDEDELRKCVEVDMITGCFDSYEDIHKGYDELPKEWVINLYDEGDIRMDIYKPGYSKGTACKFLYEKLGINREDTYAFGDGLNDREMLQLVGTGIAMGNAPDEVKAIADEVCESVFDDGVAKRIIDVI